MLYSGACWKLIHKNTLSKKSRDIVPLLSCISLYAVLPNVVPIILAVKFGGQINVFLFFFYSILFYSILFYSILFYLLYSISISFIFNSILFYPILFYSIRFYSILFSFL
jgi:hypothetical protein